MRSKSSCPSASVPAGSNKSWSRANDEVEDDKEENDNDVGVENEKGEWEAVALAEATGEERGNEAIEDIDVRSSREKVGMDREAAWCEGDDWAEGLTSEGKKNDEEGEEEETNWGLRYERKAAEAEDEEDHEAETAVGEGGTDGEPEVTRQVEAAAADGGGWT